MEHQILTFIQHNAAYAYLAVFAVLLACGLGVPLPEDITLVAGGYTVYLAQLHGLKSPTLLPMIVVGMVGVLSGDVILFMLGRWAGPRITRIRPFSWLFSPKALERVQHFFSRYGAWTAFFARFAAGLRAPTYALAGSSGMKFRTFIIADGSAAMISVPLLVYLAWRFGDSIDRVKRWLVKSKYVIIGLLCVLAIYIVVRLIARWRQRRRAQGAALDEAAPAAETPPSQPSADGGGDVSRGS